MITSRLVDPRFSRPRLTMLAFRLGLPVKTGTTLRLLIPAAHQAVGALLTIKKPAKKAGFLMVPSTGIGHKSAR